MWANTIMNAKNISMQAHQAQRILNVSTIMTNTVMSAAQAMILDLRRRFEDAMTYYWNQRISLTPKVRPEGVWNRAT